MALLYLLNTRNEIRNYFREHNQFNTQVYQMEKHHNSYQKGFDISILSVIGSNNIGPIKFGKLSSLVFLVSV